MLQNLTEQILIYSKAQEPHECCGFVVFNGQERVFMPCPNVASDPENVFEIAPEALISAENQGEIEALVHSHPSGEAVLSLADRQLQDRLQLDFWLVCNQQLKKFPKIAPLLGREFDHGRTDCYSLFKDFYYLAGADLPEFERADEWWAKGGNLYLDNMPAHGFQRQALSTDIQLGDVILMQVGADVPNHAGVYLGNQQVLHHSPKRLSKRDLYDGYWLKHTHSLWRFQQWSKLDFTAPLNNLARSLS